MREFYIYGFKTRREIGIKSARSYDDERRRLESWLGEYMRFSKSPEGKTVFFSVDSRAVSVNPFYKAWKARSFTDGDITFHFLLLDILNAPDIKLTLPQITALLDQALPEGFVYDESTVRKKLKEYVEEGILNREGSGKRVLYSRACDINITPLADALDFFSEILPCGVIGSFIRDKLSPSKNIFAYKHRYITQAIDSEVLVKIFEAMNDKRSVSAVYMSERNKRPHEINMVPLKILISAQNGRQNLIAFAPKSNRLNSYRMDYISDVQLREPCEKFDKLRNDLKRVESHMWGVNCNWRLKRLEHIELDVYADEKEKYIVERLHREKRCGRVEKIGDNIYRFTADVFDTNEVIPWMRTFICRIRRLELSNKEAERTFKNDLADMYELYGLDENE